MEVVAVSGRVERSRGGGQAIWRTYDRCCVIWVGTTCRVGGEVTFSHQSLPLCLRPTAPLPANTFSHFLILRAVRLRSCAKQWKSFRIPRRRDPCRQALRRRHRLSRCPRKPRLPQARP